MDSPVEYMKGDATPAPKTPTEIIMIIDLDTIIANRMVIFEEERDQGGCDLDITCDGEDIIEVDGEFVEGTVHHVAHDDKDVFVVEIDDEIFVGCDDVGAMRAN